MRNNRRKTKAKEVEILNKKSFIAAIDLFCGAGGLTHGLEKAGIDGRPGIDNEKSCEYAFAANNNYSRMSLDKPAPTITTKFFDITCGRNGHPEQNRAISLREGALLQTFPDTYQLAAPGAKVPREATAKLIGNAVPVHIGELIGESLVRPV